MAIFTSDELDKARQFYRRIGGNASVTKAEANAIIQGLEDWANNGGKTAIFGVIETAHAGLTNGQKADMFYTYCALKTGNL